MLKRFCVFLSLSLLPFCLAGCGGDDHKAGGKKEGGKTDEHAGHDHSAHGPHEGHLVELGEEEYHAEWKEDDDSGKVTVWILDGSAKKTEAITADSIKISVTVAKEAKEYELPAVDRTSGDKPTAFKFEIVSKELVGQLETPKQTLPKISVDISGKTFIGKIEEHAEHKH